MTKPTLSYRDAGVDIDAGERLVRQIAPAVRATNRPGVLAGLGGFGGLFELPSGYHEPVLVSGTDGVGTKLKLAIELGRHESIGIDLVAMCANDIVVCGAEPLYFLDYYATSTLDVDTAAVVIAGVAEGCRQAGCALIGGETAEMPGLYAPGDYDLAGFCVGIVEKSAILTPQRVQAGDALVGIGSSGPHSNGYSLIRKVIELSGSRLSATIPSGELGAQLLAPTRVYVKPLLSLIQQQPVHALAHITGGGLTENLPRVLPAGSEAVIDLDRWDLPPIFEWLREQGNIAEHEMLRTFNCGIGMVACIPEATVEAACTQLERLGETAWVIGQIEQSDLSQPRVRYLGGL